MPPVPNRAIFPASNWRVRIIGDSRNHNRDAGPLAGRPGATLLPCGARLRGTVRVGARRVRLADQGTLCGTRSGAETPCRAAPPSRSRRSEPPMVRGGDRADGRAGSPLPSERICRRLRGRLGLPGIAVDRRRESGTRGCPWAPLDSVCPASRPRSLLGAGIRSLRTDHSTQDHSDHRVDGPDTAGGRCRSQIRQPLPQVGGARSGRIRSLVSGPGNLARSLR